MLLRSRDRNVVHFVAGIGFGLAAGCALGILYAPQAGRRTRRQLARTVEDSVDFVSSKAHATTEYIRDGAQRLQDEARDLLDRGQTVVETGKARLEDAVETGTRFYRMAAR